MSYPYRRARKRAPTASEPKDTAAMRAVLEWLVSDRGAGGEAGALARRTFMAVMAGGDVRKALGIKTAKRLLGTYPGWSVCVYAGTAAVLRAALSEVVGGADPRKLFGTDRGRPSLGFPDSWGPAAHVELLLRESGEVRGAVGKAIEETARAFDISAECVREDRKVAKNSVAELDDCALLAIVAAHVR